MVSRLEVANKLTNSRQRLRSSQKTLLLTLRACYQLLQRPHKSIHPNANAESRSETEKCRSLCSPRT